MWKLPSALACNPKHERAASPRFPPRSRTRPTLRDQILIRASTFALSLSLIQPSPSTDHQSRSHGPSARRQRRGAGWTPTVPAVRPAPGPAARRVGSHGTARRSESHSQSSRCLIHSWPRADVVSAYDSVNRDQQARSVPTRSSPSSRAHRRPSELVLILTSDA